MSGAPALWLVVLTGSTLFISGVAGPIAAPDLVVAALLVPVTLTRSQALRGRPLSRVASALIPLLWVWALIMLVSSMIAQSVEVALVQSLKNLAGPLFFLVALKLALLAEPVNVRRWMAPSLVLMLGVLVVSMVSAGADGRASGTFPNPIYAATWAAIAILLLVTMGGIPVSVRIIGVALGVIAMYLSSSFAAYLGLLGSTLYLVGRERRRWLAIGIPVGVALSLIAFMPDLMAKAPTLIDPEGRSGVSSSSRLDIWSQAWKVWLAHPWGVGPGQFSDQAFVPMAGRSIGYESHNDYIGWLVELGPAGLIATLGLFFAIGHIGRSRLRALLVFVAITAAFHNVVNFRHFWIFFAVAISLDLTEATRERWSPSYSRAPSASRAGGLR